MSGRDRVPEWARRGRGHWRYRGQERPPFARAPGPGEESVWDYPRPPRIEPDAREVEVRVALGGTDLEVARTNASVRVLETASPPTFYVPPEAVDASLLVRASGRSACEWKGVASYFDLVASGQRIERIAWSYESPFPEFEPIRGWLAFYPHLAQCTVGGVRVEPQRSAFYGGWVTPEIVGPMKGEPGSEGW